MRTRSRWVWLAAAFVLASCETIRVKDVEHDPSQDFSAYRTFDFLDGLDAEVGDERVDNPIFHQVMRKTVTATLVEKGYRPAAAGAAPDFRIGYHVTVQLRTSGSMRGVPTTYGGYVGSPAYFSSLDDYEEGTIVIDVVDAATRRSVWRGTAQGEVKQVPTIDGATERLGLAVSKILGKFPPE